MRRKPAQIIEDYRDFPFGHASAVCLGNFDGIHRGHQQILKACLHGAKRQTLTSVLFTFHPHPTKVIHSNRPVADLMFNREEKRFLLGLLRFDLILEQKFDTEFSKISADEFCDIVLFRFLNAKAVMTGANFRFGFQARGDVSKLKSHLAFSTEIASPILEDGQVISSSRIRESLRLGEIAKANSMLGFSYFVSGEVVSGQELGRKIGFRTLNLKYEKECLPKSGVYISIVEDIETGLQFTAVTNIGVKPTVSDSADSISIETHLLQFSDDFYRRKVRIYLIERLRDEKKFAGGLPELQQAIADDVQKVQAYWISRNFMQTPREGLVRSIKNPDPLTQSFQVFETLLETLKT